MFRHCRSKGNFEFNKDLIKEEAKNIGFGNPYDVTKIDQSNILPDEIRDAGYCIVLLGHGRYKFIKELDIWYHRFEPIEENEVEPWPYKPSLLNHTDESESNIISVVYNQRIIQHFLYGDISESPMIYMSRRTKVTVSYQVGAEKSTRRKYKSK